MNLPGAAANGEAERADPAVGAAAAWDGAETGGMPQGRRGRHVRAASAADGQHRTSA